jgi:hypothetical protein
MLIQFSVENFLSFKDETTISMVAAKPFKELLETNTIKADEDLTLLKSAVVYGNNASGKSNLIAAISFMRYVVLNSFSDALKEDSEKAFPLEKFALNTKTEAESSCFEIIFIADGVKYRYGFEIDYDKIIAEWLFHTTSKEVYLFTRDLQNIKINKSAFKEGIGKDEDVKENVLFISLLATLGKEIASGIVNWFKRMNVISSISDNPYKSYTINKLKSDKDFFTWVAHFIRYLEIAGLSMSEADSFEIEEEALRNQSQHAINSTRITKSTPKRQSVRASTQVSSDQSKQNILLSYHRKFDENNVLTDTVAFNVDWQESEGTKKLIYLLGPWYDTLKHGKVLIVDELDSRSHSHLTLRLIEFFHKYNHNNAQLICAVHDSTLLSNTLFRRDQIWFIEKNQFGASELLSLGDFSTEKVRKKSAFDKNYLEGKYGAIPYFDHDEQLHQLLYGKREEA